MSVKQTEHEKRTTDNGLMKQVEKRKIMAGTFKNRNIIVVGLARSGTGAANLLSAMGAEVTITDRKERSALEAGINRLLPSVKIVTDGTPGEVFDKADMIVVSPGVPLNIAPLLQAGARGVPIIGELELAYQAVAGCELRDESRISAVKGVSRNSHLATPPFIGVTGTNGKSTVTTLIDHMLKESGCRILTGGNIGNALSEEILKTGFWKETASPLSPDFIVAEISSFQLETIETFRPRIAAILNITPDHLDRYEDMDEYVKAKARIFENQLNQDSLVLNADDPLTMDLFNTRFRGSRAESPEVFFFSRKKEVRGMYCKNGLIYCNLPHLSNFPFVSADEIKIKGVHNLENAMAAALVSTIAGCSCEAVGRVLKDFPGLEHRLEICEEMNGVKFINDSKGTNVGAVAKSLEGLENVILLMGGMDKGGDFSVLRDLVKEKVKLLILFGEAKDKIARAMEGAVAIRTVNNLHDAVALSIAEASDHDAVLLSPGCASFDMFRDFEDRGRQFKETVKRLLRK